MRCPYCHAPNREPFACADCFDWYQYLDRARLLHPYQRNGE